MLYVLAFRLRTMRPIRRQSSVRHVRERRREMKASRKIMVLALAVALPLTSCAAIQRSEVRDKEQLLATAGFQAKSADTPEKLANLREVPARDLVSQEKNGNVAYSYADPDYCQCMYVGGAKEYSAYQSLAVEKKIEQDRLKAAQWPIHR
jgi:hypothetical protein